MADEHGSRLRTAWGAAARTWRAAAARARRDGERTPAVWRATVRSRLLVCAAVFCCWTVAIEARLVYLQVFRHEEMTARANRQQMREIRTAAKRGEIFDRNGRVLAYSVDGDTIAADPTEIGDPDDVARRVCQALEACSAQEQQTMARQLRRDRQGVYLRRVATPDDVRRIRALSLPGIMFFKESRRYYPKKELAAHVLGYVGIDNVGLAGLESTYDARIRGREGLMLVQTDARRHTVVTREERPPTAGEGIELTLDQYLQHIAERELRAGIREHRAAAGSAVIMDPHSGEILALANWPTFNPNAFTRADDDARRNRAVQDQYEPGSTFKVVTASAALDEDVAVPDTPIDCSPGHITFGSRVIDDVHRYGVLSFTDVIVKSSNVGAIKVGLRLGPERLVRYVSRFGFGEAIAPDFRGENPGFVWHPARLDASALASVSMGYQVAVTAMQMAAAVSSVANGGQLVEPRVVRAFIGGSQRVTVPTRVLRRTITADTAAELTAIMEGVVERGTAKAARIEGYTIAGKTGTAAQLIDGRYSRNDYNASFVGFVPSRKPALTIVVVVDMSNVRCGSCYYGGVVAAPIFRRIAEAALRHLGVGRTLAPPAPVLLTRRDDATAQLQPTSASAGAFAPPGVAAAAEGLMPDLRGFGAREALRVLSRAGIVPRLDGSGVVIDQSLDPGTPLVPGRTCVLTLGRRPVLPAVLPVGGPPQ